MFEQQKWGHENNICWGFSESGFGEVNQANEYQYKAHGVPNLGMKQGLEQEMVVSPYSSYLALAVDPQAAFEKGALGRKTSGPLSEEKKRMWKTTCAFSFA